MINKVFEKFTEFSDYDRDQSYEMIRIQNEMMRLFFLGTTDSALIKETYKASMMTEEKSLQCPCLMSSLRQSP